MNMHEYTGRRTTGARADVNESIRAVLLHEVALRGLSARRRELHVVQIYFSLKAMTCRPQFCRLEQISRHFRPFPVLL